MNFLANLIAKLAAVLLDWGQKQKEKPKITEDANTPKKITDGVNADLADRLERMQRGVSKPSVPKT